MAEFLETVGSIAVGVAIVCAFFALWLAVTALVDVLFDPFGFDDPTPSDVVTLIGGEE